MTPELLTRMISRALPADTREWLRRNERKAAPLIAEAAARLPPTSLELFAGAGGLAIGLREAGFRTIGLVEWIPPTKSGKPSIQYPVQTLRAAVAAGRLHGKIINEDARKVDYRPFLGVDLLTGGPPCQPYSTAGKGLGANDPRDGWPAMVKAAREAKPRFVMAENVVGMTGRKYDETRRQIEQAFRDLGYSTKWQLVDASDYGVPQARKRLLLWAWAKGEAEPHLTPAKRSSADVELPSGLPVAASLDRPQAGSAAWLAKRRPRDPVAIDEAMQTITKRHAAGSVHLIEALDIERGDLIRVWNDDDGYVDVRVLDTPEDGIPPEGHLNVVPFPHGTEPRIVPVVNVDPESVGKSIRRMNTELLAAYQTFPPDWPFQGPKTAVWPQIGNAIPPELGRRIGMAVLRGERGGGPAASKTKPKGASLWERYSERPRGKGKRPAGLPEDLPTKARHMVEMVRLMIDEPEMRWAMHAVRGDGEVSEDDEEALDHIMAMMNLDSRNDSDVLLFEQAVDIVMESDPLRWGQVEPGDPVVRHERGRKVRTGRKRSTRGQGTDPWLLPSWAPEALLTDVLTAKAAGKVKVRIAPIDKDTARDFLARHHSQLKRWPYRTMYALGAFRGDRLVAVALAGHPSARWTRLPQQNVLELSRIASDGTTEGVSSMLASAMLKLAPGSRRKPTDDRWLFVTYSLASEGGHTYKALKGQGLRPVARTKGKRGKQGARGAASVQAAKGGEDKIRWEAGPVAGKARWSLLE